MDLSVELKVCLAVECLRTHFTLVLSSCGSIGSSWVHHVTCGDVYDADVDRVTRDVSGYHAHLWLRLWAEEQRGHH